MGARGTVRVETLAMRGTLEEAMLEQRAQHDACGGAEVQQPAEPLEGAQGALRDRQRDLLLAIRPVRVADLPAFHEEDVQQALSPAPPGPDVGPAPRGPLLYPDSLLVAAAGGHVAPTGGAQVAGSSHGAAGGGAATPARGGAGTSGAFGAQPTAQDQAEQAPAEEEAGQAGLPPPAKRARPSRPSWVSKALRWADDPETPA